MILINKPTKLFLINKIFPFWEGINSYLSNYSFSFVLFLILKKIITFFSNIVFVLQQQEVKGQFGKLKYLKSSHKKK